MVLDCKDRYKAAMKALTISERVLRLEQLSLRARVSLDLWIALNLDTARDPFPNALSTYEDFWRFARSDHEDIFFIRITNLFTQDKRTENYKSLITDAKNPVRYRKMFWSRALPRLRICMTSRNA